MPRRIRERRCRRGMALYVSVLATTMIVSTLGLTALAVVRIERQHAGVVNARVTARGHARSAVELALRVIADDEDWRTRYSNNGETARQSLGASSTGTVSWILRDVDGSLTNADTQLWLKGIGRVGETAQVSSVEISAEEVSAELRSHATILGGSNDDLKNDKWWGQYFKPNLPPDANGWRVGGAEIRVRRDDSNKLFRVRLYRVAANGIPIAGPVDSVDVNSSSVSSIMGWHYVGFSGSNWLNVGEGMCLTLETSATGKPLQISYTSSGVSAANCALISGNPGWNDVETSKSLRYRIHGFYTTAEEVHPIAGTWVWDAP